ncbi:uncharacterized protein LOC122722241 [Manihot esculenta]|uniref:uncharacterized protein LOC122722241 n=1 Tax=Manihot esculenta TaxID=3983 RepID=UPI001CC7C3A8|nr:uncharacterized protein LOC122722241 [Manihot esculenta]
MTTPPKGQVYSKHLLVSSLFQISNSFCLLETFALFRPLLDLPTSPFCPSHFQASEVKMDQIKPPKNLILSRESMDAALDALLAGQSVKEATQRVAEHLLRLPDRVLDVASRLGPLAAADRARPTNLMKPPRPRRSSTERMEEVPGVISEVAEETRLARADPILSPVDASAVGLEVSITEEEAPGQRKEVILIDEDVQEAPAGDAPVPDEVGSGLATDGGVIEKAGDKRPASPEMSAPAPARKKSRASKGSAPALPSLEKKKDVPTVPLMSASDNDILNVEDITHQSPASIVAEIIKERMFGGVTEASDPRLLALTGLLASSTREQAAFQSRPRGELGDTIREMLLMVDARDHSLRESVDRRVEEACLEENLSATSDARGNLAAAHEHAKSLEAELSHARRVLKESDKRATAAEVRCEEVLKQLSSAVDALRERDEAVSQKEEVQRQYEQLKVKFDAVLAQKSEAVARVVVLKQELSKQADSVKGLTLVAEESKLQNQQLCQ